MNISELLLVLIVVYVIVVALVLLYHFLPLLGSRTKNSTPADRHLTGAVFRDDDRYWYGGIFYNNPDDPEVFVPKRFGLGWTVNFGLPAGKRFLIGLLLGMLLLLLLPVLLGVLFPGLSSSGCHSFGCHP